MQKASKKHIIQIPKDVNLIYTNERKFITFINYRYKKSLFLNMQIFVSKSKSLLKISKFSFINLPKNKILFLNSYQNYTVALIKQYLIEISTILYKKLQFIGIGYRLFNINSFKNKLLLFKLGYSHFLYFKILNILEVFNFKMTKLFVFGNCFQKMNQLAFKIRLCKKPEPYKGKGITYVTEKIILKKNKKV